MTVINTNVKSLIAGDSMRSSNVALSQAMERLSTGKKINSAKDDAAGLAISTRMTSQVRGLSMAIKNANDGINIAQTAEGAMTEVTSMLQRMRELAIQAGNSTNSDEDRIAMNDEVEQLKEEINRIASTTQFNNINLLDGSFSGKLQIGNNAGQTMNIGIGSLNTDQIGETVDGAAVGSTKASLNISGASTTLTDYQGVSFAANVNGVSKTVTLPVINSTLINSGGATASNISPVIADRTIDVSSVGQLGGQDQRTADLSTAANAKLTVSIDGGAVQTIDISDSSYYVAIARATGQEVVDALQTEFDNNAAFQGANALTVSLTQAGRIKLEKANGDSGVITITNSAGTAAMLNTLSGATTTLTTNTGSLEIGGEIISFVGNTSFDVGSNHFDLTAEITAKGYDISKLTTDEFIDVYNATAKVNGVNVSTVSRSDPDGALVFTGTDPSAPVNSSFNNGSLLTMVSVTSGASTAYTDNNTGSKFGETGIVVADATDNTFTVSLDGGDAVEIDVPVGTYNTMAELAVALQSAIDTVGGFTGDNAITVSSSMDANKRVGLSFTSATGKSIELDGDFLSANTVTSGGVASVSFAQSTLLSSTNAVNTTDNSVTLYGVEDPVGVGSVFTQTTRDLSTAIDRKFVINVNGNGNVVLDLTDAFTDLDYTNTAITGEQLAAALNYTINANGSFTGNNAVTASLTSAGQIALQVAGAPAAGGNPSIVLSDDGAAASPTSNFIETLTGFNNGTAVNSLSNNTTGLVVISSSGDLEKFGVADYAVSAALGNNKFNLALGSDAPVTLTVDTLVYSGAQELVDNINAKIALNSTLAGTVAAYVSTDAVTGDQSIGFSATSGAAVTFTGGLAVDMKTTQTRATTNTVTISGVGTTFDDADKINFSYNGVAFTATLPTIADDGVDAGTQLQTAIDAAVDASGNALGSGKITIADGGADLTLTLDQTSARTSRDTDLISSVNFTTAAGVVTSGKTSSVAILSTTYDDGDVLKFSYNGVAYEATLGTTTTGADAAALNAAIDAAVDANGNVLGAGKVTATDDGSSNNFVLAADAVGNFVGSASLVSSSNYLSANEDTVFPATRAATGGVNLSAGNSVTMSVTNAAGTATTRTFSLGSSGTNVSLSDYASLLQTAANTAFSDVATTFTAAYSGGKFSIAANQSDIASLNLSGTSVSSAFGAAVSGTYAQASADVGKFYSMSDVATAINDDLDGLATASYSDASGWTFAVQSGNAGANSSITLSGSGLSTIQFAGTLTANGAAGNATADKLSDIDLLTDDAADDALDSIDNSLEYVSRQRALLGAIQNRLSYTVNNLTNIVTNTEASRSAIVDTDYSKETTALAKQQIISQAATAMLAQANQSAQSVLSLLK